MTPTAVVQEQLNAYNERDLARFLESYSEDITIYRMPLLEPALRGKQALAAFYGSERFNRPELHAEILNRIALGNKVVDHERISGLRDEPFEAVAVYEISGDLIQSVYFFAPE